MENILDKINILTNKRTKIKSKAGDDPDSEVKGYLDSIEAGFATGWALDPLKKDGVSYVTLEIDGKKYGRSATNIYRKDLADAGISSGYNGYSIAIDETLREKIGSEVKVRINDHILPNATKDLTLNDGNFWFGFDNIENCHLFGSLVSERFEGEKALILLNEGKEVSRSNISLQKGHNQIMVPIPVELFNDDLHLLTVGLNDYPFALWSGIHQLSGILTPWEYLKDSFREPSFIGLSKQAKFRYESLLLQGEKAQLGLLPQVDYSDLVKAHNEVVKGWENRSNFPRITLPVYVKPEVSIIIPAYNKLELTYHAIASIILSANEATYEVIVADDCSTDKTNEINQIIRNVVHIKNPENLRFLLSCNNAAQYAKGEYIVFLNNDTEVTSHWLDELIKPFKDRKCVGLTGSKLLNIDGTLQEAGGIIWASGQPWNVGNGANPLAPEFNYTREVDYLTGAAMCIKKSVWEIVEGFSKEYAPCYYEDTDIAFKVRSAGFKTIYCPLSTVVHFEGKSHGRDVNKGLKQYQLVNESKFKAKWFKEYKYNGEEGKDLHLQKDRNIDHRVLVIDYATPNEQTDAGSYAAVQEIKLLMALGIKVTFVPENMAHMGKLTHNLQRIGVEVLYAPFYSSVFDVIEKRINEFNAIYITRYSVAEKYLDSIKARTQAKIVFNNADLHFLRELRASETTGEYTVKQAIETRTKELAVMNKVDAILSYNETEHAVIQSHNLKGENIFLCPWVLTPKPKGKKFSERSDIAFLGGFRHHPNEEAVKFFSNKIMPLLIKEHENIKFHIYGSHPSDEVKSLASGNIIIHGFVDNLDDVFFNHKVFVAPLLSGAGIKGKVLESISYGCPQVLTKVAAEATGLSHKISAWIADEPKGIADGIISLINDEALWNRFSDNSKILGEEMYSQERGVRMMKETLAHIGIYTK